jgi:serine/threonine-protein kinase
VARSNAVPDKLIGRTLGDFRIEELLGRGSSGRVYRAVQSSLNRPVALKVLEEGLFTLEEQKSRFLREAEYIARLEHPNVVPIYTAGQHENFYYFAMRLVRGVTLAQRLREPLDLRDGLRWLAEVCGALNYAHERGVVHRDVKPTNIMIADGCAVLVDLGVARLLESTTITTSDAFVGTPLYFSPEQARQERAGPESDLYAVGIILYEMAVGCHPFETEVTTSSRDRVIRRIAEGTFRAPRQVAPRLHEAVERVILKALAYDPAARYRRGSEFRDALLSLPAGT